MDTSLALSNHVVLQTNKAPRPKVYSQIRGLGMIDNFMASRAFSTRTKGNIMAFHNMQLIGSHLGAIKPLLIKAMFLTVYCWLVASLAIIRLEIYIFTYENADL